MATKVVSRENIKSFLLGVRGWFLDLQDDLTALEKKILDTAGKIKASIIPIGSGLKVKDDKIVLDVDNLKIDGASIPDATDKVKGVVKVDGTTITAANGTISANLPSKLSELTNDSQFQTKTEVESIAAAAASAAKDELIGGAPETYDTLKEISDYISTHGSEAAALTASIGSKADQTTVDALTTTVGKKADASTTLAGYGIEDAKIADGTITLGDKSITPLTVNDISAFTDEEIEEIINEVRAEDPRETEAEA